ncbi:S9 family peptidase [Pedobacter sp. MC2016-15]|uniref:S9 family peptidase n=1 Tax=Pedobacter sp. MC2016-15 TaxID=2994473 RepID=UPI0022483128|nr:S9 family peptidase [Pedobacter sp. MC2016-15]MCX2479071.1 S9 family peptidase [Pedobacter sp. MC2016-15]
MKKKIIVIALILLGLYYTINAQENPKKTVPGNPALVSSKEELQKLMDASQGNFKYQVEDYFKAPKSSNFSLSPNGKSLAYKERNEQGKAVVRIKETSSGKVTTALEEKDKLIAAFGWANEGRLIYMMDNNGDENFHLYAVNTDGSNNIDLTPYEGVKANLINRLPENEDFVIVTMNLEDKQIFEPYRINTQSGKAEKLYENKDISNPINQFDFDKDGNLKGFNKISHLDIQHYYKTEKDQDFKLIKTTKWDDKFSILSFNYATENPDDAYVLTDLYNDKAQIVLFDFKKKKVIKKVYTDPVFDLSNLKLAKTRKWELDYVDYQGEKYTIKPISKSFRKIYADLQKKFKNYQIEITGRTLDEDQYLIKVSGDRQYGKFYHYDIATKKSTLLIELKPDLREEDMAVMKPIQFQSRDGLTTHGYITLPKEALNGKKVPVIVNPHGGPHLFRDLWGFNAEAQLFASRGYATLQINFRISDGYGKKFYQAGYHQTGRKIMADLEDGANYAIRQGWVDKQNVAIFGASHGGYATLMGLIQSPGLYKTGVDYVGISNITTFFKSLPSFTGPYIEWLKYIWYDIDTPEGKKLADEVSPIYFADKIKAPLFVVQGANDPRVNIAESDRIVEAIRKKGLDVPYMVKYDEGHGFIRESNQIDFYKAMMGFFSRHLK